MALHGTTVGRCGATMIRVLIADDHPIVREGLKRILDGDARIEVRGEASSHEEVVRLVRERRVDVLLLDISMPGQSFLETIRIVREERSAPRILVLSVHAEELYAVRALRAGAWGYLSKDHSPEELVTAIHQIHGGRRYVTASLAEQLAAQLDSGEEMALHETLSDREYEVLLRLARGEQVKEIAARLHLSPKTVSTYRARVLEKLELGSNADLVRYVLEHQLLDG